MWELRIGKRGGEARFGGAVVLLVGLAPWWEMRIFRLVGVTVPPFARISGGIDLISKEHVYFYSEILLYD